MDDQPCVLLDLAPDTHLRRFPRFELSAQTVPFSLMHIIRLFVAMDHESLSILFDVAERGKNHLGNIASSPCQRSSRQAV